MIPNTLNIFRQLCAYVPPLVPANIAQDMQAALEQLESNPHLSLEELEDTVIAFGKKTWAYRKAFYEMASVYEGNLGETMLLAVLSKSMQQTYQEFVSHGGTYRDFVAGGAAEFFSPEERITITETLVQVKDSVFQHARQAIVSTDRSLYLKKIEEFELVQKNIESVFVELHDIANNEQEHPELATEIRAHIRGLEYGLSALGPHTSPAEVMASVEHFKERKKYKMLRAT
jgi:hypothetical protein